MIKLDPIAWWWFQFSELSVNQLYEIIALREKVFIVEQNCPYLDADGLDAHAWHLTGWDSESRLIAYLRLIKPGYKFDDPALGRIIVTAEARNQRLGIELMRHGINKASALFPGRPLRISAQLRLQGFYEKLGFTRASDVYDEDGIPHIEMVHS